ncbi:MAG: molybdopterin oxidoreductase family protein [Proteobacteria bacterium]|nr:molybdopterin oxidoreductase family protein [Pseudomonadota bacterium]
MTQGQDPKTGEHIAYHTCPLCEATCGLEFTLKDNRVIRIRGDKEDVFSTGYLCPKGASIVDLHNDPDRLRTPMVRTGDTWKKVSWDEAFAAVEKGLLPLIKKDGNDAVALYLGNPNAHTMAASCFLKVLIKSLKSKNIYSSSSVDQIPKHVSCGFMFGSPLTIPIPDIDRTNYFLILGANPLASNGSLCTAPDFPGRLRSLKKRGGKLVVIDPCRTKTAQMANEHHFIRPGTDALFLLSLVHVLFKENLVSLGKLDGHVTGIEVVKKASELFSPESVEGHCGINKTTIFKIARELAAADKAVVYARMGTSVVEFGTLSNWLVDVLNVLTGNLDKEGGAMFPMAAHVPVIPAVKGKGFKIGRWKSRVKGLPEVMGEFPAATLADEIVTPGSGQIKALLTVAANPVISNPNSTRLDKALSTLDFMVAVDFYLNETNRHAHVILPPASPLSHSQYDFFFYGLSVRNIANFSPPVIPCHEQEMDKWMILIRLASIFSGMGATADPKAMDDMVIQFMINQALASSKTQLADRSLDDILAMLDKNDGPVRILDFLLRTGPYGDGFGLNSKGLSLDTLLAHPHGIDLGPLKPRIPEILLTPSGKIELAPDLIVSDIKRLHTFIQKPPERQLVLISRRHLRSNNSWFHNLPKLVKGKNRCTLQINPEDASLLGLEEGCPACVSSAVGALTIPIEISGDMMKGVVSIPHGWGHDFPGMSLSVAASVPGVNSNILADEKLMDTLSGNAVLNGIPVSISVP